VLRARAHFSKFTPFRVIMHFGKDVTDFSVAFTRDLDLSLEAADEFQLICEMDGGAAIFSRS
jgi:hypothetical protein